MSEWGSMEIYINHLGGEDVVPEGEFLLSYYGQADIGISVRLGIGANAFCSCSNVCDSEEECGTAPAVPGLRRGAPVTDMRVVGQDCPIVERHP
jgi:hypothetical protein